MSERVTRRRVACRDLGVFDQADTIQFTRRQYEVRTRLGCLRRRIPRRAAG